MSVRSLRRPLGVLAVGVTALVTAATLGAPSEAVQGQKPKPHRMQQIQILSFNDFHGNLEPPSGSSGRIVTGHTFDADGKPVDTTQDVGGVEYLASHLERARAGHDSTLTVAAGDIIGATPLLSAAFHDEPTIESMNKLGLDVSVGRQPRVRRGLRGAPAHGRRRLHRRRRRRQQPELLPGRHVQRRELRLPGGQRRATPGTQQDDPPALRDQGRQRRQDRLHRDDPQGHARHRDRGRHPGPRRSPTRSRRPTSWCRCSRARASRRSWCCSTRAACPSSSR